MVEEHDNDNKDALRAVAHRYYLIACRCLENDGYVQSVNMVRIQDDEIPIIFSDNLGNMITDKDVLQVAMRSLAKRCTWIAQITEAWTLTDPSTYDPTLAVSQHPDKSEGIYVTVQSRKGTYMIFSVFKRDKERKPLRPTILEEKFVLHNDSISFLSGRMMNYYHE